MLTRQLAAVSSYISIHTLSLLVRKLRDIIPILLQAICDLIRRFRVAQLKNRIVVHRPVLSLLVRTPDLLTFDAEDLDTNAAWRRHVVRNELRRQGGVAHDAVVAGGFCEHALSEVWWEVFMDDEFAYYAL